ncbi:hypothetical protein IP88_03395 [alpha proteobacterium AAP81b]|nr:hypothetical protein IP88_03395 [alpha proteobacterium AAP81b]
MTALAAIAPAPAPAPSPAPVSRIAWLDIARGLGIVLVVIGHCLGGLIDSSVGDGAPWLRPVFFAIYTFHMPLFFVAAGVLVDRRLARDPIAFRDSLWSSIAWPYFLWSFLQFSLIYALGSAVNAPVDRYWPVILALPWKTVSQFWFLHALFQLHLLALLCWRRLGSAAFLLLMLSLKPLAALLPLPDVLRLAANQAPYYGIGVVIGTAGLARAFVERSVAVRLALLPLAAVLVVTALWVVPGLRPEIPFASARAAGLANIAWSPVVLPAAFAGLGAVVALASLVGGRLAQILGFLGRRSMAIFILHIMAVAGTRIIAIKLGLASVPLLLVLTAIAGLTAPLVAYAIFERFGLVKRLGLG